jgi:hypothetical protein
LLACSSIDITRSLSPRRLLAAAATEQLLDLEWYVRDATDCVSVVTDASRRGDFPFTYSISPLASRPHCTELHPCHVSRTRAWRCRCRCSSNSKQYGELSSAPHEQRMLHVACCMSHVGRSREPPKSAYLSLDDGRPRANSVLQPRWRLRFSIVAAFPHRRLTLFSLLLLALPKLQSSCSSFRATGRQFLQGSVASPETSYCSASLCLCCSTRQQ